MHFCEGVTRVDKRIIFNLEGPLVSIKLDLANHKAAVLQTAGLKPE